MLRAVVAWWSCRVVLAVAPAAWERIARGAVHVERDFVPRELCEALRRDARDLHERGLFRGDGLYETGKARAAQGFSAGADRQTYTGGWAAGAGDVAARAELAARLAALRSEARGALRRATMGSARAAGADETTYNWYEPRAALRRHIDERHEETKGRDGWRLPTRRSLTWLVYLNDAWEAREGGALRCYERARGLASDAVGAAADGDVQVGWLAPKHGGPAGEAPVFLGDDADLRHVLYAGDEAIAPPFAEVRGGDLSAVAPPAFAPIVGATPRASPLAAETATDVLPRAGTLVLFDSVAVPHEVLPVTASRPRIAATGWFHEALPDVV